MTDRVPSVGDTVLYMLSTTDADQINKRRKDGAAHSAEHLERSDGSQVHVGNHVKAGNVYPLIIAKTWGDTPTSAVNGQVILDGNDTLWATSVSFGDGERHFQWPAAPSPATPAEDSSDS
jgi:hypothetical protein